MSLEGYPQKTTEPEVFRYYFNGEGNAGANLTKIGGSSGISVARSGVGGYSLTFEEDPGSFLSWTWSLGADAPENLEDHTVLSGGYVASTKTFIFTVSSGTTNHDLVATEFVYLQLDFQRTTA